MTLWLVLAAIADSLTYLLLPTGAEANPLWASQPQWAVFAKAAGVVFVLALPLGRYRSRVLGAGAAIWTLGAVANLTVLGVL